MIQLGSIKVHLINDGITHVDPGGMFGLVPRVLWRRYIEPDENHLITSNQNCLLVQAAGRNILVDTGLGTKLNDSALKRWQLERPNGDIVAALRRLGLTPADVDIVINTHLHADHCGGNTKFDEHGDVVASFPNAEHVVQWREFEDATHPNERTMATYLPENWNVLMEKAQIQFLDGDTEIVPGVWGIVTPGHTPGHMSILMENSGQHMLFTCDLASYAVHFERLAWMTAYDVEPLVTLETKRHWQQWALEHNAVLIFPHDALCPIGRLVQLEPGKLSVRPIKENFA